jgi:hypothetical protein
MPDLDQIKQEEQEIRDRRRRSSKGGSGDPAFKPNSPINGASHHAF